MSEKQIKQKLERWLGHLEMLEASNMLTTEQKRAIADDIVQWAESEFRKLDNGTKPATA
jgi:hypothetical protein